MNGKNSRYNSLDAIVLVAGLLISLCLPYKAELFGSNNPLGLSLMIGPVLLFALAASVASRPKQVVAATNLPVAEKERSGFNSVFVLGLVMLLVGGGSWVYMPIILSGKRDLASDMLASFISAVVGFPGLILTLIGFVNMRAQRRKVRPERERVPRN